MTDDSPAAMRERQVVRKRWHDDDPEDFLATRYLEAEAELTKALDYWDASRENAGNWIEMAHDIAKQRDAALAGIETLKGAFDSIYWMAVRYAHGRQTGAGSTVRRACASRAEFGGFMVKPDTTLVDIHLRWGADLRDLQEQYPWKWPPDDDDEVSTKVEDGEDGGR